ncbi:MAG: amidohydrolase family protein [Thaumarchaeota archaeon]|nr:amidohydrolase family protein [Nitrososphaerota archaeon]
MENPELLIKNGKIVTPLGIVDGDMLLEDGRIAAISKTGILHSDHVLDVTGKYVLPGVIDPHTELGPDGLPSTLAKNLRSETPSMVLGGVTSFFTHFRGQRPYGEVLHETVDAVEGNSLCNVGLHVVMKMDEHLDEMEMMARNYGVTDFKFYPGPRSELFPGGWGVDDGFVFRGFAKISSLGHPCIALAHCENWVLIAALKAVLKAQGQNGQLAWCESRPNISEEETVVRMVLFAKRTGCPLYIPHITTAEAVKAIEAARKEGYDIIGETMPHFLTFNKYDKLDPVGKHFPPLRSPEDVADVWRALNTGTLSTIGSDHLPDQWRANIPPPDDIWKGRGANYAGAGTILPVMLTEGLAKGRISIERLVEVCCTNPAKAFGAFPRKGALLPGSDADMVIVDLHREVVMRPEALNIPTDYIRFEGMRCMGWPVMTMVGGQMVMEEGNIVEGPGVGAYLSRSVNGSSKHEGPRCS